MGQTPYGHQQRASGTCPKETATSLLQPAGAVGMQDKERQIWLLKRSWGANVLYKNLLALFFRLAANSDSLFVILRGPNRTGLRARYGLYAGRLQTLLRKVLL